jgi:hypothetical protein
VGWEARKIPAARDGFFLDFPFIELTRWDEKAGLLAGCDTLPMFDVLEAQEKETGNAED